MLMLKVLLVDAGKLQGICPLKVDGVPAVHVFSYHFSKVVKMLRGAGYRGPGNDTNHPTASDPRRLGSQCLFVKPDSCPAFSSSKPVSSPFCSTVDCRFQTAYAYGKKATTLEEKPGIQTSGKS